MRINVAREGCKEDSTGAPAREQKSHSVDTAEPGLVASLFQLQHTHGNRRVQRLLRSGLIQAKLTISEPGDRFEQDADRVADQVMRMNTSDDVHYPYVQRACAKCEEEIHRKASDEDEDKDKLHRQVKDEEEEGIRRQAGAEGQEGARDRGESNGSEVSSDWETGIETPRGSGQPLPEATRRFFEPRFGHDFSQVRIHTDSRAAEAARAINALAFTIGHDVVFGAGQYSPDSAAGKRLLAHELTHTLQQENAASLDVARIGESGDTCERKTDCVANRVMRRDDEQMEPGTDGSGGYRYSAGDRLDPHVRAFAGPGFAAARPAMIFRAHDFDIRGVFSDSARFPNLVFFSEGSAALLPAEKAKIVGFAMPASDVLTLNGFASEEGPPASNSAIVNSRLDAVAAELVAGGHDAAKITKTPQLSSGEGRIDYRRMRSVEIVTPGGASAVPSAAAPATAPCAGSNETDFTDAEGEAEAMISASVTALTPPIGATMSGLLTRFFPGWAAADAAKVSSNLSDIKTQLGRLLPAANHQCAIIKYAPCEAGTEAQNTSSGAAAMMTMCPVFFAPGKSKKRRGGTLIHEASHGTPGLTIVDKSYSHERRIVFLPLADALVNADSYVLLVRLFDTPGSMSAGPAAADPLGAGIAPGSSDETAARRTIAWMEKWLVWSYQEMSSLYDTIHQSIAAGAWTNTYYRAAMGLVAPLFGVTAPPALPTKADQFKVAAIHDRFHIMRFTEKGNAITLNKVAVGTDQWAPGPGASVNLTAAFFADTPRGQLDRMLTAIATATPDVSAVFVPKYVELADKIRTHMGEGSP